MAISGVSTSASYDPTQAARAQQAQAAQAAAADAPAEKAGEAAASKKQDAFVKSGTESVTYSKKATPGQLMQLEQQRVNSFTQMLRSMVVKQGETGNLSLFGLNLNVTPADSAKAAAAIGEGGEYSVDAVATRILDMAKALAGGDESKISTLREAVEKGFKAAGVDLGGKLPGICNDTHTEVMKRFDEWENESRTRVEDDVE